MGAGASIPIEKWSAYRLAAYSNEKSLPIYITKIIDKQQLNGATILNLSEYDIKRFTNKKDKQDELWKHCKMLQRIASRNRGKDISVDDVKAADEAFFTGTAAEVTPVVQVDQSKIDDGTPGKITKKIHNVYFDLIRGKNTKYEHWLTRV